MKISCIPMQKGKHKIKVKGKGEEVSIKGTMHLFSCC